MLKPTVYELSKQPAAKVNIIPKKNQGSHGLLPPKINPVIPGVFNPVDQYTIAPQGFFRNFSTDDGLALDAIWASCTDHKGNIWFGTDGGGLSRYDGKGFTNFTSYNGLASMVIKTVFEDKKGNIWIGTFDGGVSCFNGRYFVNYTNLQGLANNQVLSGFQDRNGRFWFGTYGGGLSCYTPANAGTCGNNSCGHVLSDTVETIKHNKNIAKGFTNYTLPGGLNSNIIWSLCEDSEGRIWCGTNGNGVFCFSGKIFHEEKHSLMNFKTENGMAGNLIRSIMQDGNGNIWFATDNGAACLKIFEKNNLCFFNQCKHNLSHEADYKIHSQTISKALVKYTKQNGLPGNLIRSISEDNFGNIWFGTNGDGVSCLSAKHFENGKENFINYSVTNGLANNVIWCMTKDRDGNIWLGTDGGGLSRYDGPSFINYTSYNNIALNNSRSIIEDTKGYIWVATFGSGVYRFKHAGETNRLNDFINLTEKEGLSSNLVVSCLEDSKGIFGLARLEKDYASLTESLFTKL